MSLTKLQASNLPDIPSLTPAELLNQNSAQPLGKAAPERTQSSSFSRDQTSPAGEFFVAPKKTSKTKKAKPPPRVVKTSPINKAQTTGALRQQLVESLQRENATSEVLRLIASSAKNLQQVLSAVAENAARLIDAQDAIIHRLDGDVLHDAAHYGLIPRLADAMCAVP